MHFGVFLIQDLRTLLDFLHRKYYNSKIASQVLGLLRLERN